MEMITADDAAERLGVKVETVYAYVSRGALTRHRRPGSRRSSFDAAEVERLARRGRPRRTTRPPALDFSIETGLTEIDDHRISVRGHDLVRLATNATFEQVAELLWTGELPERPPRWEPLTLPPVPDLPAAHDRLDRVRLAVVLASAADPLRGDLRPTAVAATARSLLATAAQGIERPHPGRNAGRVPTFTIRGGAPVQGSVAGRLWGRLAGRRADQHLLRVLDAALVLLSDHEMASSTLAARVAASTRADPYAVVLAGLGTVAGPLHGGASRAVWRLLRSAAESGPSTALVETVSVNGHVPGFGHPLYPNGDPRAQHLLGELRAWPGAPAALATVEAVLDGVRSRGVPEPNIDFALGALAHVARMPVESGEVVFSIARTAGWIAHGLEEYGEAPLRFRARAVRRA